MMTLFLNTELPPQSNDTNNGCLPHSSLLLAAVFACRSPQEIA
jgi:hypothetical protein